MDDYAIALIGRQPHCHHHCPCIGHPFAWNERQVFSFSCSEVQPLEQQVDSFLGQQRVPCRWCDWIL